MSGQNQADHLVTVFGGSGFVGRYIVRGLAQRGYRIRVAVRRPADAYFLQPFGDVGQIQVVQANLRDAESVAEALKGSYAAVNAVGILYETRKQTFDSIHGRGAAIVAEQAAKAGVKRLVHISALGADSMSPSDYAESKAAGERGVRLEFPGAAILQPSVIFGPEDGFFNMFAAMARISPVLPLIGGGDTKFQPVFVGDVAEAALAVIDGDAAGGQIYELGGPEQLSFREILEFILKTTGRKRLLVPVPFFIAKIQAWFLQMWPWPLLTVDQVLLLQRDNVVGEAASREGRDFSAFGITPRSIEVIVPSYLSRFRAAGQFDQVSA
ncbi:MAG: complex I NDUFA9 subunit family protein [Hyphomicrobiales bacterium]|nr:MAG: complex I NDUFA9 subunit family protein [Hyphomicrobiales bacterium]